MKKISVAIDGPAGAGKSTIARKLASKMGFIYVDTGALYRTVALSTLINKTDIADEGKVDELLGKITVDIEYVGDEQHVLLSGEDVSDKIRTPEVSDAASKTSALPKVRAFLLGLQQKLAREHDVIMDGRDIATVVLPNADVKIFLTASAEVRAKRRYDELIEKGQKVTYEDVYKDMVERDERDMNRAVAPLRPAEGARIVDTSGLSLEDAVALMEKTVTEVLSEKKN